MAQAPKSETQRKLKHAGMQLVAGGSAGCVEGSLMHPLDLVKTRFQLQSNSTTQIAGTNPASLNPHHHTVCCIRHLPKSLLSTHEVPKWESKLILKKENVG